MSANSRIVITLFVFSVLIFVLELLRRRKISEATTLWWLFIISAIMFLTFNDRFLSYITASMRVVYPITVLILFSMFFILIMLIYFSMKISVLSSQIQEICQYIAIFKAELSENKCKTETKSRDSCL